MTSASDIYIEATETDPNVRAQVAVGAVHRRLLSGLAARVRPQDPAGQPSLTELTGYCTGELRRHLAATDDALYGPASGAAETRQLVRALRTSAAQLGERVDALAAAPGTAEALAAARAVEAVLEVHLTVERTVLLPALAALPGADLPALVADLEVLLSGGRLEQPGELDVREIPHGQRHPRIFARYARLAPGESFVLVNNHDPKPLRREFQATHPGAFSWDYEQSGPDLWKVRIGRVATGD